MCTVSVISSDWINKHQPFPDVSINAIVTREEFDKLKTDVAELRTLIKAAKAYDEATGQADCEDAEKVELLNKLAAALGLDAVL